MKKVLCSMLVVVVMCLAAPAYSAEVTQVWFCEMEDAVTEKAIIDGVGEWLKAARQMEGGENLEASVLFPVAVATGEFDVMIVFVAPSFQEWGQFWDGYEGSPAAILENEHYDMMICPDSALWESVKVKVK